jgi:hypothetical protein
MSRFPGEQLFVPGNLKKNGNEHHLGGNFLFFTEDMLDILQK